MNPTWPARLLDQLENLDVQEAPHGLYGIRRAYAPEGKLPSAAHVLSAPDKAGLLKECGFGGGSTRPGNDVLSFAAGSEAVSLQVLDYATTKVRHYGSAFRIDKRHRKASREPVWDLESLVPKLRRDWWATRALLLIAHYRVAREMQGVLGKTIDLTFLDRYALAHDSREWEDRRGRGFRTALHLWAPRADESPRDLR